MRCNLMHFSDFSKADLLIIKELIGETLAKSRNFFYLVIFRVSRCKWIGSDSAEQMGNPRTQNDATSE